MKAKLLLLLFVSSLFWMDIQAQSNANQALVQQTERLAPQRAFQVPAQDVDAFRQRIVQDASKPLVGSSVDLAFNFDNYEVQFDEQTGESYRLLAIDLENPELYSVVILYFEEFDLQGSDQLSIVTGNGTESEFVKTFNFRHNQDKGVYALGFIPISSDRIYLKLTGNAPKVSLERLGYIFKDDVVGVPGWGSLNSSLGCIRPENVNCPQYSYWCDEKRSVFKMCMTDNNGDTWICSGALVTNERADGFPYALTAHHCIDDGIRNELTIYMFNYESPNCNNINGPITETVSGSVLLNDNHKSDYAILRLTDDIPKDYNVFYAGWTNDEFSGSNDNPTWGAGIHHPNGDIKKMMTFNKKLRKRYVKIGGDWRYTWRVKIDQGGLEGGSSGSPLFQGNKQLIGQLSGGQEDKACEKKYYGRFHRSWHHYGLSWILNPNGDHSGSYKHYIKSMSGFDPCVPNYNFTNAHDLHTSANVTFLNYAGTAPRRYNGVYVTSGSITASQNVEIQPNTYVEFDAGTRVILKPGFHAEARSHFLAHVGGCEPECGRSEGAYKTAPSIGEDVNAYEGEVLQLEEDLPQELDDGEFEYFDYELEEPVSYEPIELEDRVSIFPNPAATTYTIDYDGTDLERIEIYSSNGILIQILEALEGQQQYPVIIETETSFHVVHIITQQGVVIQQVGIARQ
ncbi:T9SS type A sorting domain-containing protein [bacterium SCSIO 12741]|nr:T9SS type A sorting domain-containing protein [bacterium SCSIO 12741]